MEFLERLRAEREDHDESQRSIAKALSITQAQYWKYETGANAMPIEHLVAFCHHYRVSADYLLGIPYTYRKPR